MGRPPRHSRDELVGAAIGAFTDHGYAGLDVVALCDALGIGRSSFYHGFGDKDALFDEALRAYTAAGAAARERYRDSAAPAPRLLHHRLTSQLLAQYADENRRGCLVVNTALELGRSIERYATIIDADREGWVELYAELIARGQRQRHLRAELDPRVSAGLLHTAMAGLRVTARIAPEAQIVEQIDALITGWCTPSGSTTLTVGNDGHLLPEDPERTVR